MAKMKESGIEWIGDIPENWEISKLKTILKKHAEKIPVIENYYLYI